MQEGVLHLLTPIKSLSIFFTDSFLIAVNQTLHELVSSSTFSDKSFECFISLPLYRPNRLVCRTKSTGDFSYIEFVDAFTATKYLPNDLRDGLIPGASTNKLNGKWL